MILRLKSHKCKRCVEPIEHLKKCKRCVDPFQLWMLKDIDLARNYFQKWYYWGTHSNIKEIARLAKMVDRHLHGILEAMRSNLNNGVVEGLNNKIKTGFKRAYGFKTRKYRNTMIYLMAGKLSLPTRC